VSRGLQGGFDKFQNRFAWLTAYVSYRLVGLRRGIVIDNREVVIAMLARLTYRQIFATE
jgi:hypothetical protein